MAQTFTRGGKGYVPPEPSKPRRTPSHPAEVEKEKRIPVRVKEGVDVPVGKYVRGRYVYARAEPTKEQLRKSISTMPGRVGMVRDPKTGKRIPLRVLKGEDIPTEKGYVRAGTLPLEELKRYYERTAIPPPEKIRKRLEAAYPLPAVMQRLKEEAIKKSKEIAAKTRALQLASPRVIEEFLKKATPKERAEFLKETDIRKLQLGSRGTIATTYAVAEGAAVVLDPTIRTEREAALKAEKELEAAEVRKAAALASGFFTKERIIAEKERAVKKGKEIFWEKVVPTYTALKKIKPKEIAVLSLFAGIKRLPDMPTYEEAAATGVFKYVSPLGFIPPGLEIVYRKPTELAWEFQRRLYQRVKTEPEKAALYLGAAVVLPQAIAGTTLAAVKYATPIISKYPILGSIAKPIISTAGVGLRYGLPAVYAASLGTEVLAAPGAVGVAGVLGAAAGGEILPFMVGGRIGSRMAVPIELKVDIEKGVARLPKQLRGLFRQYVRDVQAVALKVEPTVKNINLANVERLTPKEAAIIKRVLKKYPAAVVGGSVSQNAQIVKAVKVTKPSDLDLYSKSPRLLQQEIYAALRRAGIKRVSISPKTGAITIRGQKAIEIHHIEKLIQNIQSVSPHLASWRQGITQTPEGIPILKLTIQARRKLIGGFLQRKYEPKDIKHFKRIYSSLLLEAQQQITARSKFPFFAAPRKEDIAKRMAAVRLLEKPPLTLALKREKIPLTFTSLKKIPEKNIKIQTLEQFAQIRKIVLKRLNIPDKEPFFFIKPTKAQLAKLQIIEPQVSSAIKTLQKKGYKTISSGFSKGGKQTIEIAEDLSPAIILKIRELGGTVIRRDGISFISINQIGKSLSETKIIMDRIVNVIPTKIGKPPLPRVTPKKVKELKVYKPFEEVKPKKLKEYPYYDKIKKATGYFYPVVKPTKAAYPPYKEPKIPTEYPFIKPIKKEVPYREPTKKELLYPFLKRLERKLVIPTKKPKREPKYPPLKITKPLPILKTTPKKPPFTAFRWEGKPSIKKVLEKVRKITAWETWVKTKGEWLKISEKLPRQKAIAKGEEYVGKLSLSAQFRIIPKGVTRLAEKKYEPSPLEFRGYKIRAGKKIPMKEQWIERREKRLEKRWKTKEVSLIQKARTSSLFGSSSKSKSTKKKKKKRGFGWFT